MDKREEEDYQLVFTPTRERLLFTGFLPGPPSDYNILRSIREGELPQITPSWRLLYGWIKEELYLDFGLAHADNIPALLENYVHFFNHDSAAASLHYLSGQVIKRGFL